MIVIKSFAIYLPSYNSKRLVSSCQNGDRVVNFHSPFTPLIRHVWPGIKSSPIYTFFSLLKLFQKVSIKVKFCCCGHNMHKRKKHRLRHVVRVILYNMLYFCTINFFCFSNHPTVLKSGHLS